MKINDIFESTTSGSVASVAMPLGGTQKREGSLFKGKKTKKKFYEGKVKELMQDLKELSDAEFKEKYGKTKAEARQALQEDEVNEADLILVPGHGQKMNPGLISKEQDRRDHEVEMARSDLYQAAKNAQKVYELIQHLSEEEGLEGWVQEKIIKANDYLNTIREYLEHKTYMQEELMGGVIAGGQVQEEDQLDELSPELKARYRSAAKDDKKFNDNSIDKAKRMSQEQPHKKAEWEDEVEFLKSVNAKRDRGLARANEEQLDEKKDACYNKVKSRYKVWPSAYASGALVKCRKVGASNWGNKSKK